MTDRDAFVLGVSTYCKTAEMDADDTLAFVSLLLSEPKSGAAIVKRAHGDGTGQPAAVPLQWGGGHPGQWGGGQSWGGYPGQWGGGAGRPPPFARVMAPGGRNAESGAAQPAGGAGAGAAGAGGGLLGGVGRAIGAIGGLLRGGDDIGPGGGAGPDEGAAPDAVAPGGKNVETGETLPDRPYAIQGEYLAGLTGLTDKERAQSINQSNERRIAEREVRRHLRQLGISYGDAERMTPEQMAGASYSPQNRAMIQTAQKIRAQQRSAAGGRGFSQYGGGFSMPSAAPTAGPPTAAGNPATAAAASTAPPSAAAAAPQELPSSSPPTETQRGNVPMQSTTDPTVNPGGAEYTGPTWTSEATNAGAMQSRRNQAARQMRQFAQRRPELRTMAPEHFQFTGGASPVSALPSPGRASNPATAAASLARPPTAASAAPKPWSATGSFEGRQLSRRG